MRMPCLERLTTAPVLVYSSFDKPFTVETDASISDLGSVLSPTQGDTKLHPVAYTSRSLSTGDRNYSITELETLTVIWALTRFHSYLCDCRDRRSCSPSHSVNSELIQSCTLVDKDLRHKAKGSQDCVSCWPTQ